MGSLSFSCSSASLGQISSPVSEMTRIYKHSQKAKREVEDKGEKYIQVSRSGLCIQHPVWTWPSRATPSSSFVETHSCDAETRIRSYTTSEKETFKRSKLQLGLTHGSVGKDPAYNAGDLGSIPGSGRSPGGGNGNPLQHSCLGNPMDRGGWWATVQRVT